MMDLDTIHKHIDFCCAGIEILGDEQRANDIRRQLAAVNSPDYHGEIRKEYTRILQLASYELEIHKAYA